MGIYISSYAVRAKDLEKAIGSSDNRLYEDVLKGGLFDDAESALKDLIFNRSSFDDSDYLYLSAFESLCSYLGEELHYYGDFKVGYFTDIIDDIFESDFGLNVNILETIINERELFGLPISPGRDSICSGLLDRNDLLSLQSQFKKIQITDDLLKTLEGFENEEGKDGEPSDKARKAIAYPIIKKIKENISYCVEGNFGLVSFCS